MASSRTATTAASTKLPAYKDIEEFKTWALKMGCPIECLPQDIALQRVFSTPQGQTFFNLKNRVHSRDVAEVIRKNILIWKLKKYKNCEITLKKSLPIELQRFLMIKKLKQMIKETNEELMKQTKTIELLRTRVDKNNVKRNHYARYSELAIAKSNLLKAKLEQLKKDINTEEELSKQVDSYVPIQRNNNEIELNHIEKQIATTAINEAMEELNNFHQKFENQADLTVTNQRNLTFNKLKKCFSNIPMYPVWMALNHKKSEQIDSINSLISQSKLKTNNLTTTLSKSLAPSNLNVTAGGGTICDGNFNSFILHAQAKQIAIVFDQHSTFGELEQVKEKFLQSHQEFMEIIGIKLNLYNENFDLNVLNEYFEQFHLTSYLEGQLEYLTNELEKKKLKYDMESQNVIGHMKTIHELNKIYSETSDSYQILQKTIQSILLVKEKLQNSEHTALNLLKEIKCSINPMTGAGGGGNLNNPVGTFVNTGNMTISSFDSISNSVLCSTKLEDNNSMINGPLNNSTDMAKFKLHQLPQHLLEFNTFLEIPIEKLDQLSNSNAFTELRSLSDNSDDNLQTQLSHHLINWNLFTNDKILENLLDTIDWEKKLKNYCTELKTDHLVVPKIDEEKLITKFNANKENLIEMIDELNNLSKKSETNIKSANKYYRFLMENSLEKFIPNTERLNGRSFQDYYDEFLLYYNIIQDNKE